MAIQTWPHGVLPPAVSALLASVIADGVGRPAPDEEDDDGMWLCALMELWAEWVGRGDALGPKVRR